MNSISQLMKYRKSMVEYALKHGVAKTAIKYNTYRQYVYRWLRRYDGSLESLRNKSRRPKHHPKAHTAAELKLIQDMRRRNPEAGLVVFWVKLRQRGYSRSITGLYRTLKRIGVTPVKPPNPKSEQFFHHLVDEHALPIESLIEDKGHVDQRYPEILVDGVDVIGGVGDQ